MKEKYLPIGSVVTVKNLQKKVMIIGYYSLEYQNSVKIYDYIGCSYPEGMLLKNQTYSFNHSDIISCDFMGFVDEAYKTLNKNLNGQVEQDTKDMEQPQNFLNLKFDENGVVVYEEMSPIKKAPEIVRSTPVANPFEHKSVKNEEKSKTPVFNNSFKFDENGVVVEDNTVKENKKDIESNFKYTFDENGFVIGEEPLNSKDSVEESVPSLFDEDVPTDNKASDKPKITIPKYTFDENGFVVSDSTVKATMEEESKTTEKEKDEFKVPHYRFDENGIIISE